MEAASGTYALILRCPRRVTLGVGALGELTFRRGHYLYVGSAFGPGGVLARARRHIRTAKPRHWHVDYLTLVTVPVELWYCHDVERREHRWADALHADPRLDASAPRFGASDCLCASHLFFARALPISRRSAGGWAAASGASARTRFAARGPADERRGGVTPAIAAARGAGVVHRVHEYAAGADGASYGEEAALALGVPAERVFKTLVVAVQGSRTTHAVAIVPVAGSLDLKALAAALGAKKASMAEPRDAERLTGYVLGGISPLGQRCRLPALLDASALHHTTVYVSAGRRGLEIELAPADLVRHCAAATAEIAR